MNKLSGKAGSLVAPIAPAAPHEADVADPVEISAIKAEQRAARAGKYGAQPHTPFKAPADAARSEEVETSWIEIELIGEDDQPVAGERYRVTLPDQSVDEGCLDHNGFARIAGFAAGTCLITFPDLDQDAWSFVESAGPKAPA